MESGLALRSASCVVVPGKEAEILQKSKAQHHNTNQSATTGSADNHSHISRFKMEAGLRLTPDATPRTSASFFFVAQGNL